MVDFPDNFFSLSVTVANFAEASAWDSNAEEHKNKTIIPVQCLYNI